MYLNFIFESLVYPEKVVSRGDLLALTLQLAISCAAFTYGMFVGGLKRESIKWFSLCRMVLVGASLCFSFVHVILSVHGYGFPFVPSHMIVMHNYIGWLFNLGINLLFNGLHLFGEATLGVITLTSVSLLLFVVDDEIINTYKNQKRHSRLK